MDHPAMNPAVPTGNTLTFVHFPSLLSELRVQIWLEALPRDNEPALYFYRKECWQPGLLSDSDNEERWDFEDWNLTFALRTELLDPIQIYVPMAFVNHEARGVALRWMQEQGMAVRFCEESQRPVFTRPFDTSRDVLYLDNEDAFCIDPVDRMNEPDLNHRSCSCHLQPLRLAVPERMLKSEVDALPELLDWFRVVVLYVIVNPPSDLCLRPHHQNGQQWWQLRDSGGDALVWNRESGRFNVRGGQTSGENGLSKYKDQVNQVLAHPIHSSIWNFDVAFDILPVFAIKR